MIKLYGRFLRFAACWFFAPLAYSAMYKWLYKRMFSMKLSQLNLKNANDFIQAIGESNYMIVWNMIRANNPEMCNSEDVRMI